MIHDFPRLFAYDQWANRETLASLRAAEEPPARSVRFMAHIVAAEHLWLDRLERVRQRMAVWPDLSLEQCGAELEVLAGRWGARLGALSAEGLAREVPYVNTKGESFTSRVEDIFTHVLLHSAHHRGQIASDLRVAGHQPAYTDFIHAVRKGYVR